MGFYLVERYTPSLGPDQVAAAVGRLAAAATPDIRHLWTVLIPGEETCLSLFAAASAGAVAAANARADFAFSRIIVALAFGKDHPPCT